MGLSSPIFFLHGVSRMFDKLHKLKKSFNSELAESKSKVQLTVLKDQYLGRKKGKITLQTGYGPSGLPHIGTFGEVARTTMVVNALNHLIDFLN